MKKTLFTAITLLFIICNVNAQTVIGGGNLSEIGAILDFKEFEANDANNNTTANKGVLLPRVLLTDVNDLKPAVTAATDNDKKSHIGLIIYHVGGNNIKEGLKIWTGTKWSEVRGEEEGKWFYMPPFPIPMYEATEQKINLYEKYLDQMNPLATIGVKTYKKDEITFHITGYDSKSFEKVEIKDEILTYKANTANISTSSYLNIIIKVN